MEIAFATNLVFGCRLDQTPVYHGTEESNEDSLKISLEQWD